MRKKDLLAKINKFNFPGKETLTLANNIEEINNEKNLTNEEK